MNNYILLAVSILITLAYTVLRNQFSKKHVRTQADFYLFNAATSAVSFAVLLLFCRGMARPSAFTLLMGAGFGILTALAAVLTLCALQIGPLSYTTLLTAFSAVIPAVSGRLFWSERLSAGQGFGIALMLVSIFLSVKRGEDQNGASPRWLLFSLGAFLSGGLIGLMQKIHQSSPHKGELNAFLLVAFAVSAVLSLAAAAAVRTRLPADRKSLRFSFSVGPIAVFSGVCIALANQINLFLSGAMPSAVFFPVVNGVGLILAVLASSVFFHEKPTRRQWAGLAVGTVSVLLVCGLA